MRRLLLRFLGVLAAGVLVCWRATLRVRVEEALGERDMLGLEDSPRRGAHVPVARSSAPLQQPDQLDKRPDVIRHAGRDGGRRL